MDQPRTLTGNVRWLFNTVETCFDQPLISTSWYYQALEGRCVATKKRESRRNYQSQVKGRKKRWNWIFWFLVRNKTSCGIAHDILSNITIGQRFLISCFLSILNSWRKKIKRAFLRQRITQSSILIFLWMESFRLLTHAPYLRIVWYMFNFMVCKKYIMI